MGRLNWRHKKLAKHLSLAKLRYGDVIPLFTDVNEIKDNLAMYSAIADAAAKGYLQYGYDTIIDDEGIPHPFERGYRFTDKGLKLLEEASK